VSDNRPAAQPADGAGDATEPERNVTFRDVFAVREYRAVYFSLVVNWIGDYLARAAILVLIYQETESVLLSAASFAVSYLPWIVGGPVLAALAERYPYRRVLIAADLARAVPIALIALPGMNAYAILGLLFVAMLGAPPTQAARSALMPLILGRRLVVSGLAINASTSQAAQVFGYVVGATVAVAVDPRLGIGVDALSFVVSAALIAIGVRPRPAARDGAERRHLLRETGEGFRLVFGTPLLRSIALLVFAATTFTILPEGLAAGWAALFDERPAERGFDQGLIMAAGPVGFVVGGLVISRLVRPAGRVRLVKPFAVLIPVALALTVFAPNAETVAALVVVSGIAQGGLMPTLNGEFVLALPHGYRARAYGVMQGGVQFTQCFAVLATGALAQVSSIPLVVGLWSLAGVVAMVILVARRPSLSAAGSPQQHEEDAPPAPGPAPRRRSRSVGPAGPGSAGATRVTPSGAQPHEVQAGPAGKMDG
jgi:MFS family permease